MNCVSHKRFSFNPDDLLIDHTIDVKFNSDIHLSNKHLKDENEQKLLYFISDKEKFNIKPYYSHVETVDFLSSKLRAMENMDLDDECSEGKIETKKINIDKSVFPKSKHSENKKCSSPKKKHSKEKSNNKKNNKNIVVNADGKVEQSKIDLLDDSNLDFNKEIKKKELNYFFSSKTLLISIINEMK